MIQLQLFWLMPQFKSLTTINLKQYQSTSKRVIIRIYFLHTNIIQNAQTLQKDQQPFNLSHFVSIDIEDLNKLLFCSQIYVIAIRIALLLLIDYMQRKIPKQDRKFFKPNSISQCLRCSICFQPFHEPTRLFCGHTFCWQCLQSWSKSQSNCPICRTRINSVNIGKDLLAFNIINELTVFCCHNDCSWKGPLQNLEMHVNFECIFDEIEREAKANNQGKSNKAPVIQIPVDEEVEEKRNENISKGNLISRVMMKDNKFGKTFDLARKIIRAQSRNQKFSSYSQSKAKVGKKKGKQQQQIRIKSPQKSQSPLGDLDFLMQLYQSK